MSVQYVPRSASPELISHEAPSLRPEDPIISIVIPAYNEEAVVHALYDRLSTVMRTLGCRYELIFVNDGSSDSTLYQLLEISQSDPTIKIIDFSRNFGHQIAVSAGIEHATGDAVVLIDADLQDPPELIQGFLEKWRDGYDVVYAMRAQRDGETWFKKQTARMFYRTLRRMTELEIALDTGDFRLMDRTVVDSLLMLPEKHRFIRGMVSWVGYRQTGISYQRDQRFAGESKYPLKKMVKFALDGVTSFSIRPLQFASGLGFLTSFIGFLSLILIIVLKIFTSTTIQGWTSLIAVSLFLGGIQLLMLGIVGEYIGRIYDEVRDRPLYLVKKKYNLDDR